MATGSSSTTFVPISPLCRVVSRRLTLSCNNLPQSRTQLTSEIVTRDKELQSRFGHFRHSDMVGKPWGTKLSSSNGRGFVFLLKPTPELWCVGFDWLEDLLGHMQARNGPDCEWLTERVASLVQDTSTSAPNANPLPPRHRFHHQLSRRQSRQPSHRSW